MTKMQNWKTCKKYQNMEKNGKPPVQKYDLTKIFGHFGGKFKYIW